MKRIFDISLALFLLVPILFIMIPLFFLVKISSNGPFIHWSKRIGRDSSYFFMPKIRTMIPSTPQLATHLLKDPDSLYTPYGKFLRKYSLDELPQIYSVLIGHMSFVGPRPALYNQNDLNEMRKSVGVDKLMPGITGWAQVNGRDEISIETKVDIELDYLEKKSFTLDILIIWMTIKKVISKDNITH